MGRRMKPWWRRGTGDSTSPAPRTAGIAPTSNTRRSIPTRTAWQKGIVVQLQAVAGSGARSQAVTDGRLVPGEGVEPTHPFGYQILSLARLPIPPSGPQGREYKAAGRATSPALGRLRGGDHNALG